MFYETIANKHGLKHDPFKALVAPRPIGWISTVGKDGICNIAPYSFFNAVGEKPHYVIFSSAGRKDSLLNIEETGEFVCSLATWDLRFNMNMTSAAVPHGVDEFPIGDLTAAPSRLVKPPRVKESPAALECKHWKTVDLPPLQPGGESQQLRWCSGRWSASTSTTASSRTAWSTPAPCAPSRGSATWTTPSSRPRRSSPSTAPPPRRRWPN